MSKLNGRYLVFVFLDDLFIDKTVIEEGYAEAQNTRHPQYGVFLAAAGFRKSHDCPPVKNL